MSNSVKVYTINGAATGSTTSLPDWLIRKRAVKGKGKRVLREHVEGTIDLIQHFEFPEASNRIRTTRDGHHAVATGVYKPQMRVWDLDQLTLKFERHADVENVDFLILSNDWTKTAHLQTDRTIELHTQGGFHYRTRIPCFGRGLAYHFPSCDLIVAASGPEVYRLNLSEGRFMVPLDMSAQGGGGSGNVDGDAIEGVNTVDINPAHQLFAFAIDGNGTVQFWDPRSRSRVGVLTLPAHGLLPVTSEETVLSATAIASRSDGLSYAIGTSTGHTLLYDIRSRRHFAMKDQGYGLPVKCLQWVEGGTRVAGDGMVISADKKVIKIWDRNSPSVNLTSITPSNDINHLHQVPGSGLIMLANEGIQMNAYYIPQLGPAPKWCSFLDNITEEIEDQAGRSVYEDYKFVERSELAKLGLDHLIGTPALKPYMHGYFLSLKLYDTARVIANPYVHEEHRQKVIQEKLEKQSETRIRTRKGAGTHPAPKVNKELAEKIRRETERELKREERKKLRFGKEDVTMAEAGVNELSSAPPPPVEPQPASLLTDERFKALFEDPEFEVDPQSREFNLLNPSTAELKRRRTAVEEEDDESEKMSSDDDDLKNQNSSNEDGSSSPSSGSDDEDTDSSDAGDLQQFNPRARGEQANGNLRPNRALQADVKLVPLVPRTATVMGSGTATASASSLRSNRDASFGERRRTRSAVPGGGVKRKGAAGNNRSSNLSEDGVMEMTWVPRSETTSTGTTGNRTGYNRTADRDGRGRRRSDDDGGEGGGGTMAKRSRMRGTETFGAGMEKGRRPNEEEETTARLDEASRFGRTKRRSGVRSGSKNVFRQLS